MPSKGAVTLSPTRQHDTTFTQYLVCDGPISYYVRGCVEHSAHKVSYWPITDQTLRKCRVVMSCRMQCESSFSPHNPYGQFELTATIHNSKLLFSFISFSFQLTTKVVSCTPAQIKLALNGKKQNVKGFELTLEDTVLFPEGGGQVFRYHIYK